MANKSYQAYQNKKNKIRTSQNKKQNQIDSKEPHSSNGKNSVQSSSHTNTQVKTQTTSKTIKLDKQEPEKQKEKTDFNVETKKQISKNNKTKRLAGFIILLSATLSVGGIASLLGGKMNKDFVKPPAFPPDWLFPAIWGVLYVAIAVASFLAYFSQKDNKKRNLDLVFYTIHLFFNMFWAMFFFRLDMMIFATIWLAIVVSTAIIVTYRYYKINYASGNIFTIYTLWLIFAMYLSLATTILTLK